MKSVKNIIVPGVNGRPMATDIFLKPTGIPKPVIIYAHGFNGFKDWGNFDLIATRFAEAGFVLIKFNFSHNGTTPEQPEVFADLEAFGNNNYTRQLNDLGLIIDWALDDNTPYNEEIDGGKLYLCGHSMGGGIVILKAAEDPRVKKLVTWAAISECKTPWGSWPEVKMNEWRDTGVQYYQNTRTNQQMPLYYQLYKDFQKNADRLDIKDAIYSLTIPILICHGTEDSSVQVKSAYTLKEFQPAAKLFLVTGDHVFGRKHPWQQPELPIPMQQVLDESISFLGGDKMPKGA